MKLARGSVFPTVQRAAYPRYGRYRCFFNLGCALLASCFAGGCLNGNDSPGRVTLLPSPAEAPPTEQEVWNALSSYLDVYDLLIRTTADRVSLLASNNRERRAVLEWRINGLRLMRSALKKDAPMAALLDAWTLTLQLREFNEGRVQELPPEVQEPVRDASMMCVTEIEKIALHLLKQTRFDEVREQVYAFARENGLTDRYSTFAPKALSESRSPALRDILAIPLAPFQIVQGIDSTAQAVHEFNKVAIRFADSAEDLPEALSSQLDLTLLDLSENDAVKSVLSSTARVGESTARFADAAEHFSATADALPERLRSETQVLIEDLGGRQEELRATIQQIETATKSVDAAVQRVRETTPELATAIEHVATAGKNLTETAHAIREMVAYFQSLSNASRPMAEHNGGAAEEGGHPFDVREYDSAAQSIATAARETRELSERLRGLLDDRALQDRVTDLDQRLAANIDRAAQRAEALASSVMLKSGGLLIGAFILALLYRFVTGRRSTRVSGAAG